jgi:hypothetical protein
MAGGLDWALVRLDDLSRIFQPDDGTGDWYLQRRYVVEITRKVLASNIDLSGSVVGRKDGSIQCMAGGVLKSRGVIGGTETSKYVCRADSYSRIEEAGNYYQQTQVWEWMESEDDAELIFDNPET